MLKYSLSIVIVVLWIILINKAFPSDHENSNLFTVTVFVVLACWAIGGVLFVILKYKSPSTLIFTTLVLLSCFIVYNFFPWYKGFTGIQIIKDYSIKKKSIKEAEISWVYSLPPRIENFPLIDLAQKRFVDEINPDKCYLFQCFYYDSNQVQKYIDQYIIYYKNKKPFTTNPSVVFTPKSDGLYELVETINGKTAATILSKDTFVSIVTSGNHQPPDQGSENYYFLDGQYRFELKRISPYNGFNIRKAYWIYNFL